MAGIGIGWYGPLIDVSKAASHVGGYVQLLVFVHTTRSIQRFKSSVLRTDVQVGDDTRSHFSVSIWQKDMGSKIVSGDVILLQNVKIVRFGGAVEAGTVQVSSLISLVHPLELLISKGVEELASGCRVAETTKEKLKKVIKWVQRTRPAQNCVQAHTPQRKQLTTNWKVHEERVVHDCNSISELLCRNQCCKETFSAFVGEIFLPFTSGGPEKEIEEGMMFIRRRLFIKGNEKLVEDLICLGCKLCSYPMASDDGSLLEQRRFPLYCQISSNRLHDICSIYRPFLLYVWDESDYIPLLVKNKGAEVLFGNITAERVYSSYMENNSQVKKCNFHRIWLVLLGVLLQQGLQNSCLRFQVNVNTELSMERGRFELLSATMPPTLTDFF
ncbi:hypothetical protein ACHQM5_017119 [Ranunculus cassubicifolius]